MSLRTWLAAYCPVTPQHAKRGSWLSVLKHARRYYTGLIPKHIRKHGIRRVDNVLVERGKDCEHVIGFGLNHVCVKAQMGCQQCKVHLDEFGWMCNTYSHEFMLDRIARAIAKIRGETTV